MKPTANSFKEAETTKISQKHTANAFSVNRHLINAKWYHDKFLKLPLPKAVKESLYQSAMTILEHRNGSDFEDLYAIDIETGTVIICSRQATTPLQVGFKIADYHHIIAVNQTVVLLHNHPGSTRPSITDIRTLYTEKLVLASVIIGHDGSVQFLTLPTQGQPIDKLFDFWYTANKQSGSTNQEAVLKATDKIYEIGAVCFETY